MSTKRKEYWKNEKVYSWTGPIEDVLVLDSGVDLLFDKNSRFVLDNKYYDKSPRIGDILTVYTVQLTRVVGVEINGKLLFFLPDD